MEQKEHISPSLSTENEVKNKTSIKIHELDEGSVSISKDNITSVFRITSNKRTSPLLLNENHNEVTHKGNNYTYLEPRESLKTSEINNELYDEIELIKESGDLRSDSDDIVEESVKLNTNTSIISTSGTIAQHETQNKPFTCPICGEHFTTGPRLKIHMMHHSDKKPFPCTTCGLRFSQKTTLDLHMLTHPNEVIQKGNFETSSQPQESLEIFDINSELNYEKELIKENEDANSDSDDDIIVEESGKQTITEIVSGPGLIIQHNPQKPHMCPICSQDLKSEPRLRIHMQHHSIDKPFSCTICGLRFSQKSTLKMHVLTHSKGPVTTCSHCDFKTSSKHIMNKHNCTKQKINLTSSTLGLETSHQTNDEHADFNPFTNLPPIQRAASTNGYDREVTVFRQKEIPLTEAKKQKKSSSSIHEPGNNLEAYNDLQTHFRQQETTPNVKQITTEAGNNPESYEMLLKHLTKLVEGRDKKVPSRPPIICDVSDDSDHEDSFTIAVQEKSQKMFECNKCNFKTNKKDDLMIHTSVHLGIYKKYSCCLCIFKTHYLHRLKQHMLIHSGEKPHACIFCDYRNRQNRRVMEHIQQKHNEELSNLKDRFNEKLCPLCDKIIIEKFRLKKHLLLRHTNLDADKATALFNIYSLLLQELPEN